jgi:histidine ammonia-lyase
LTLEELVLVARHNAPVEIGEEAREKIEKSRGVIEDFVARGKVVYGVTTGIGKFCEVFISKDDCVALQKNIIMSHAAGAGDPFPTEVVRGIMLLRLNNFAKGFSGVRMETVDTMIAMLNKGVHPVIPQKGSLGSSGDLAPLSHMVLPMIGMGRAEYRKETLSGEEAMKRAGIPTISLYAKEGVALINGTQVMTSVGALALYDALSLVKTADISAALTFEACNGIVTALDEKVHDVRPHKGQIDTAKNLRNLLDGSEMTTRQGDIRVQDPYTLRCVPQIHGATKNAVQYIKAQVELEMNSVTDNPIIFAETDEVISGGNFHGQPMALSFDFLSIAMAEIADVSERRIERLVNPQLNYGLPGFLIKDGGLNSGYMILQYSAAALVSENKILAHPSSVDSIPSSANQEDHVSMGTIGARKAAEIIRNVRRVIAMELVCAAQAIDLRGKKKLGRGSEAAYRAVREVVEKMETDREVYNDINACEDLLVDGRLLDRVEKSSGEITV